MALNKKEKAQFIKEMSDGVKEHMLSNLKDGDVPEDWDGNELRHWMLSIVQAKVVGRPLEGKRKKEFKNHLIINPNL